MLEPIYIVSYKVSPFRHVKRFAGRHSDLVHVKCLFQYEEPVSPHLAAKLAQQKSNGMV
jgi:dethiobiotin synthetase/adenosylmethionine--8-amino-7-oxononanoate aminotransferase